MLKRLFMPLFIHSDNWKQNGFRQSVSSHFHDYVFKYHGMM